MDAAANSFVLALYRAARRLPHAELRTMVFEGLQSLVTFDSAFWYRWAADAQHSELHAWCLYQQPESLIEEYASEELWRDDIVQGHQRVVRRIHLAANAQLSPAPSPRACSDPRHLPRRAGDRDRNVDVSQ